MKKLWTSYSEGSYGYGFEIGKDSTGLEVGHSGGFPGVSSELNIFVDKNYVVVTMSNRSGGAPYLMSHLRTWVNQM